MSAYTTPEIKGYLQIGNLLIPHDPSKEVNEDATMRALESGFNRATEKFVRRILYIGEDKKS